MLSLKLCGIHSILLYLLCNPRRLVFRRNLKCPALISSKVLSCTSVFEAIFQAIVLRYTKQFFGSLGTIRRVQLFRCERTSRLYNSPVFQKGDLFELCSSRAYMKAFFLLFPTVPFFFKLDLIKGLGEVIKSQWFYCIIYHYILHYIPYLV